MKKELNIVIAGAFLWCAGFFLAPIIAGTRPSELLYSIYSVVCHQFGSRSFHLYGASLAVCIRCSSIYISFLVTLIVLRSSYRLREVKFNGLLLAGIAALPMAVDGVCSLIGLVQSTDISRLITGAIFGAGMALLLHQPLSGTVHSLFFNRTSQYELKA
ncbi:MAG: DUF2085 domain-containing protein [Bacteroidota bacterium]